MSFTVAGCRTLSLWRGYFFAGGMPRVLGNCMCSICSLPSKQLAGKREPPFANTETRFSVLFRLVHTYLAYWHHRPNYLFSSAHMENSGLARV